MMTTHAVVEGTWGIVYAPAPWTTLTTSDGVTAEMTTHHTGAQMSPEAGEGESYFPEQNLPITVTVINFGIHLRNPVPVVLQP